MDRHLRFLADVRGIGRADIVGFGDAGVYVALSNGDGTFSFTPVPAINDFGFDAGGWRVDKHPRFSADLGNKRGDIVGFGDAGVYVSLANLDGTYEIPRFVLANLASTLRCSRLRKATAKRPTPAYGGRLIAAATGRACIRSREV